MKKFPPIYCISLKRRQDRRKAAVKMLKKLHLPYELFDAIDGKNIDDQYMKKNGFKVYKKWKLVKSNQPFYQRDVKTGEIGCALSHYFLWKKIVEKNLECAVILEDDALPLKGFQNKIKKALRTFDQKSIPWDFIYLCRNKTSSKKEKKVFPGMYVPRFSYVTVGYAISQAGARRLLAMNYQKNIIAADEFLPATYSKHPRKDIQKLFGPPQLKAFAFDPIIVRQASEDSDTEASTFLQGQPTKSTLLKTTSQLTVGWINGNFCLKTISSKKEGVQMPAKSYGETVLTLLNEMATPRSVEQIARAKGKEKDADNLLEYALYLLSLGALQVVRW